MPLKPDARLKWIELKCKDLRDEDDMVELASEICDLLQAKHKIEMDLFRSMR